jgi:transposase-like protein
MKKTNERTRPKFTAEFKAKVAVEALKAHETINQIAGRHLRGQPIDWFDLYPEMA